MVFTNLARGNVGLAAALLPWHLILQLVLLPLAAPAQLIFLSLAIAAMFASQGSVLLERPDVMLRLLAPLLLFFVVDLALGLLIGRVASLGYASCAGFCFATLSRNSPVALAIAVAAFPERPLIALALVIGPLIELPVLALVAQLLTAMRDSDWRGRFFLEKG